MIYLLCGLSFVAGLLWGWTLYDWSTGRRGDQQRWHR